MPISDNPPKPDAETMLQAEEILKKKLFELGVDYTALAPHEISRDMHCSVYPDGALCYAWRGEPLLAIVPEKLLSDQENKVQVWNFCSWDKKTQNC